jgi:hypothetical protein
MSDEFLTLGLPFGSFSDLSKEIAETEENLQTVPRSRRSPQRSHAPSFIQKFDSSGDVRIAGDSPPSF